MSEVTDKLVALMREREKPGMPPRNSLELLAGLGKSQSEIAEVTDDNQYVPIFGMKDGAPRWSWLSFVELDEVPWTDLPTLIPNDRTDTDTEDGALVALALMKYDADLRRGYRAPSLMIAPQATIDAMLKL